MCFKKKYKNTDNQHSVTQQKTCIHLKSAFAQKLLKSQRQDTNSAVKLVHRSITITEAHKNVHCFCLHTHWDSPNTADHLQCMLFGSQTSQDYMSR